ncbi:sulfurtransferase [Mycolicibacter arupensis]|uniref:Sulfurtransferase n=1 Tax=Mycolicibacter arupensis TaxID=342002 RepID=A0A0F5MZG5_9MYCO|nr:sulfurtransferase [Mycolicibacter arupensis]KAA1431272.1 sulfurtransferase [Mycolicibacter arupensis]KKC00102.1 thiosulfate sulfurtransferase [Mycolicibacter arupensis]MCV7276857.1 sulfurtransferase [Mycolicibacter arupensis]OQZ95839.1 sulfurtransferase [Mycolicibacter arupensis]TXI55481.1 MAG: sulfurtransferase [Mycolicibacter arupensis]
MGPRGTVLITAAELAELLRSGDQVTVLDVRWSLDEPDGHPAYLRGHLPGAVYVSLEDELSDHTVADRGRHPLPTGRNLEAAARRWGVRRNAPVVVYDDWQRAASGRLWWLLTTSGVRDVRILDGGLPAWIRAGGELDTGDVWPEPGNVTLLPEDLYDGLRPTLTADEAGDGARIGELALLDARGPDRFRGETEPLDAVAGHIPGAQNLQFTTLLAEDGTFLPDDEIAALLADRGISADAPVGAYCGSGISATVIVAALAVLGRSAAMFPGSWSQWSSDSSRPVARGAG